ncbi:MAG TPA: NAD(P)/FAD-dependent oxidoreductase [Flavisolibacter sp.]|nr:NAD(P)/FAD-dependent oxidoreductase [Flavisolibacter sp.]
MQTLNSQYDIAIVGGGLAGLSAAILLARSGRSVVLFEKEKYPYHKVCGEYISMESWPFLQSLGMPLKDMDLPIIDSLLITAPNGKSFHTKLPLGGFGISRYTLDHHLAEIAKEAGVHIFENTKVNEIQQRDTFFLNTSSTSVETQVVKARVCCAAFGKKSNIDVKWKRTFLNQKQLNNYVGVKYHIETNWPKCLIGLHNFQDGYCGISKVDGNKYCLCFMTTSTNLKKHANDITRLQNELLSCNPHLKQIFQSCKVLPGFPITISQINFNNKTVVENGVLMLGDAAGMITPLSGNGMSIALHTGKIAANLIDKYFEGEITISELEKKYTTEWKKQFSKRMWIGRLLQKFFGSNRLSNFSVGTFKALPFLAKPLIRLTHGKEF